MSDHVIGPGSALDGWLGDLEVQINCARRAPTLAEALRWLVVMRIPWRYKIRWWLPWTLRKGRR